MSISCIAIDDDLHSLENLISYMEKVPELKLVQTFTEPLQALSEISVSDPVDIIFMDVEMPALSGIELASLVRKKAKFLIFTTAHTRYALDAFKVEADAYLLKPYSILNFAKTINNLFPAGSAEQHQFSVFEDHFFYVPAQNENNELVRIDLSELIAVENQGDNIVFFTNGHTYISAKIDFAKMIQILVKHPGFIQISTTTIISKQHIKSVLGTQILLSGEIAYAVDDSHSDIFSTFLSENLNK